MLHVTLGGGHGERMVLGITDTELSLVLNFIQALMLAWMTGRQAHATTVLKDTNAVVRNGYGKE